MQHSVPLFATLEVCNKHQVRPKQKTLTLWDTEQPECSEWETCPCCNKKMVPDDVQPFSLRCNPEELAFLGPSVCLYFSIVKFMLIFMCIPLAGSIASVKSETISKFICQKVLIQMSKKFTRSYT